MQTTKHLHRGNMISKAVPPESGENNVREVFVVSSVSQYGVQALKMNFQQYGPAYLDRTNIFISKDQIEGLPLLPDILRVAGFKRDKRDKTGNFWTRISKDGVYVCIRLVTPNYILFGMIPPEQKEPIFLKKVSYFHEFQNFAFWMFDLDLNVDPHTGSDLGTVLELDAPEPEYKWHGEQQEP